MEVYTRSESGLSWYQFSLGKLAQVLQNENAAVSVLLHFGYSVLSTLWNSTHK